MATQRSPLKEKLIENLVIIGAVYYFAVKPIFEKLGIVKTPEDTSVEDVALQAPSKTAWSGDAFKKAAPTKTILLLTSAAKKDYATKIFNALNSFWGDDENAVIAIFRSLKTQSQVADLAQYFRTTYNVDLFETLKNGTEYTKTWRPLSAGLSSELLAELIKIVNAKPKYNV
jgi:hypothetical protein